jgi:hypothetical protein
LAPWFLVFIALGGANTNESATVAPFVMILLDQAVSADHKQIMKRMCSVGNTRQSRLKLADRIFLTTVSSWSAINQ